MYAVLNPSFKLAYMKRHWDTEYYKHAEATIERVVHLVLFFCCMCTASGVADSSFHYDSYYTPPSSSELAAGTTPASTAQMDAAAFLDTGVTTWMYSAVQKRVQAETALADHRQGLHDYLDSPLLPDKTPNLVAWWGVSHVAIALAFADANSSLPPGTRPPLPNPRPCSPRLPRHSRFSRQV